jgi:Rod binding domain-containing protein
MNGLDAAARAIGLVHELEPKLCDLKKATDGFETIFIKNLVGQMRKGVKQISLGENPGGDIYQDFADQALSESLSQKHVLGIGDMLFKSFSPKLVELERQRLTAEARSGT